MYEVWACVSGGRRKVLSAIVWGFCWRCRPIDFVMERVREKEMVVEREWLFDESA